LCPFESRVIGIGPQIGFIFPVAGMQGYLNLKAYWEFDNANRPDGWNAWVTHHSLLTRHILKMGRDLAKVTFVM
jgi:hypothetical protein